MRKDSYKRVPLKFLLDKQEIYRDIHWNPPDELLSIIFTQIPYLELWSEDALIKLFSGTLEIVGEFCRELILESNVRLKMESNEITLNKLTTNKRKIQNFLRKLVGHQKYIPNMSRDRILTSIYNLILSSVASIPRNTDGSLAITTNPGYPFWVAGIEDIVGQRPPTPPYDMFNGTANGQTFQGLDGGLPRHALKGYSAGAKTDMKVNLRDFSKEVHEAPAVFYPETGTDVERIAFDFHGGNRCHDTVLPDGSLAPCTTTGLITGGFKTNGYRDLKVQGGTTAISVQPGAPFGDPCIDDTGKRLLATTSGKFFNSTLPAASADPASATSAVGTVQYGANNPRIYRDGLDRPEVVLATRTGHKRPKP